ncbi:HEAT repeat domain-containing protein [Massilia sp. SYSU DXS3249]
MNDSTLSARAGTIALSFALGFGLAWFLRAPEAAPGPVQAQAPAGALVQGSFGDAWTMPGPASVPVAPAPVPAPVPADVDALWAQALAPGDRSTHGYDAEDALRKLVQGDPAARRKLLARFDTAQTPQARALLVTILSTVPAPDVLFLANRLANGSNPADRQAGFEMLRSLAPDAPETRALVRRTLATEQSPELLAQALSTLQSGAADPEEAAQMVAQLASLAQHADPAVRSASIRQLGLWDKGGESGERLSQALADGAPEVRQAAIFAIAQAGVRTPAAKAALLALAGNPLETRAVRGSAMQVLERFALSKEEYAALAPLRGQGRGM